MGMTATALITYESTGPCPTCGVEVFMPAWLCKHRRQDKRDFYCFNGHVQSFTESENDRLKRELEAANKKAAAAEAQARNERNSANVYKGKLTSLSERIKNGVCPCCKRSFTNLRRHMATKHPEVK